MTSPIQLLPRCTGSRTHPAATRGTISGELRLECLFAHEPIIVDDSKIEDIKQIELKPRSQKPWFSSSAGDLPIFGTSDHEPWGCLI